MPHISEERYAVVSCHVERPLDDTVWAAYERFASRAPAGFAVAALLRPPDDRFGESWTAFVARARQAAAWGPVGHHTHWTSPSHARPLPDADEAPGDVVRREAAALAEHGVRPTLFCGGGWYTDASVIDACADLGYVDLTPRAVAPAYLDATARWASLDRPALIERPGRPSLRAVPTTRSVGDVVRGVVRPGGLAEQVVHVYLHDTDLVDARRRRALGVALRLLALRRRPMSLADAASLLEGAASRPWESVARPVARDPGE